MNLAFIPDKRNNIYIKLRFQVTPGCLLNLRCNRSLRYHPHKKRVFHYNFSLKRNQSVRKSCFLFHAVRLTFLPVLNYTSVEFKTVRLFLDLVITNAWSLPHWSLITTIICSKSNGITEPNSFRCKFKFKLVWKKIYVNSRIVLLTSPETLFPLQSLKQQNIS